MGAPNKSTAKNPSRAAAKPNVQAKKAVVNNRCVSNMHATINMHAKNALLLILVPSKFRCRKLETSSEEFDDIDDELQVRAGKVS
jgi:hypothetical protein